MVARNLSRDEILNILDDWSDSDADGMSSNEEEYLVWQAGDGDESSRQLLVCFFMSICHV